MARRSVRNRTDKTLAGQRRFRRKVSVIIFLMVVIAISAAGYKFYQTLYIAPELQIRDTEVLGNIALDKETILQAARIPEGINLLALDCEAVAALVETIPYVRFATVSRSFPDLAVITVIERKSVALIMDRGRAYEVDEEGIILREVPSLAEFDGPMITQLPDMEVVTPGQTLEQPAFAQALAVYRAWLTVSLSESLTLSEIAARKSNEIVLIFDELSFETYWGRKDPLEQAFRFERLWQETKGELPCQEYLDLRFEQQIPCK